MASEQEDLRLRLEHLGRNVPTMRTTIIEGNRWMIEMARLQYDIACYTLKLRDGLPSK